MVSEKNILIDGLSTPYRLDRNLNGSRLMLFVREDIPSNLLEQQGKPVEVFLYRIKYAMKAYFC